MTDLRLDLTGQGADFLLDRGDLVLDEGLETPIIVSLFSDRRADPSEALPEESGERLDDGDAPITRDPRGFWADTPADRYGSGLWLLSRHKAIPHVASQAREAIEEALDWITRLGIAGGVDVETGFVTLQTDRGDERVVLDVQVRLRRGSSRRWDSVWEAIEDTDFAESGVRIRLLAS